MDAMLVCWDQKGSLGTPERSLNTLEMREPLLLHTSMVLAFSSPTHVLEDELSKQGIRMLKRGACTNLSALDGGLVSLMPKHIPKPFWRSPFLLTWRTRQTHKCQPCLVCFSSVGMPSVCARMLGVAQEMQDMFCWFLARRPITLRRLSQLSALKRRRG